MLIYLQNDLSQIFANTKGLYVRSVCLVKSVSNQSYIRNICCFVHQKKDKDLTPTQIDQNWLVWRQANISRWVKLEVAAFFDTRRTKRVKNEFTFYAWDICPAGDTVSAMLNLDGSVLSFVFSSIPVSGARYLLHRDSSLKCAAPPPFSPPNQPPPPENTHTTKKLQNLF